MKGIGTLDSIAYFIVLLGAFNWGLVGVFDYNLVTALFGSGTLMKVVYVAIGFSAVYLGFTKFCK